MTSEPAEERPRSRRSLRDRDQHPKSWVSARVRRAAFVWSPLVAFIGCVAGGWFLIRLILVSTGKPEYPFGPDVLVAGVVLLAWAGGALVLLSPPPSVLARYYGQTNLTGVVWSLGRRFRIWNVFAVPFGGLLLGLLTAPPVAMWTEATSDVANRSIVTAISVIVIAVIALFLVRLGVCGVELTSTTLIARGYLWTRRYPREQVVDAEPSELGILADVAMTFLMNSHGTFYTLKVRHKNGRTRLLYASNSSLVDIEHGSKVVGAWLADDRRGAERPNDQDR